MEFSASHIRLLWLRRVCWTKAGFCRRSQTSEGRPKRRIPDFSGQFTHPTDQRKHLSQFTRPGTGPESRLQTPCRCQSCRRSCSGCLRSAQSKRQTQQHLHQRRHSRPQHTSNSSATLLLPHLIIECVLDKVGQRHQRSRDHGQWEGQSGGDPQDGI